MDCTKGVKFPEEIPKIDNKQIKEQNRLLRNIFIGIGVFALAFIGVYFYFTSQNTFEYKGVDFKVHRGTEIQGMTIYSTSVPVTYQGSLADYNFYFRNDPRTLDSIPFDGEIRLSTNAVINMSGSDFNCEGMGIIGIANLVDMYRIFGVNVIKDENAICDPEERYLFIQIQPGPETKIEQTGPICYTLSVKECEILKATEKLMIETFVRFSEVKDKDETLPTQMKFSELT